MDIDSKPPVEPGDIVMVDCREPKGSSASAWVPASVVHAIEQRMEHYRERFRRLREIQRGIQRAMFGDRHRGSDEWDSSFPGPLPDLTPQPEKPE